MTKQFRGVNLGGWLVVEKWLTPNLFAGTDAVDEYTLSQTDEGKRRLRRHRDTFITEKDFRWLSAHGVTIVRIPVGYWLFDAIDGFTPTVTYLDKALRWATKHDIKVIIDLHGVRGSQNGFDSSGRQGKAAWFTNHDYQTQTLDLLTRIATTYRDAPSLWGIEILNEPTPGRHTKILRQFYQSAYKELSSILRSETVILFHDAFRPWTTIWTFHWLPFRRSHPIMIDIHWYGFHLNTKKVNTYLRQSGWIRKLSLAVLNMWHPVVIGEWSSVLPQRFFDAMPLSEHKELLRQNIAMQETAYKRAVGHIYWNYKAEGEGMWNYQSLVESGII